MEFIPEGATVKKHHYKEILRRLRNTIRRKLPELWRRKNGLLLYDNAPAHCSVLDQGELAKQQVAVLPHPPYSPDLAQ
jgi:histone-lysine N-methyltransferase SETMAR